MHFSRPSRRTAAFIAATGTFFLSASLVTAQVHTGGDHAFGHSMVGTFADDGFGTSVAVLEDLNGDGTLEYAVGAPEDYHFGPQQGSVRIFDGATETLILEISGPISGGRFGSALSACHDLDGDGLGDLLVGAPQTDDSISGKSWVGAAFAFSSATGLELFRIVGDESGGFLGEAVAPIADLNQDGMDDLIISQSGFHGTAGPGSGAVRLHSGADGSFLWLMEGPTAGSQFGYALDTFPDRDGDGLPEILVGSYLEDSAGLVNNGAVFLLSSVTGNELMRFDGTLSLAAFGNSVAHAGDVNGDGIGDLLVGAPQFAINSGFAQVLSGVDGSVIHALSGDPENGAYFGGTVASAGDINGDGVPDQVVSAWRQDQGRGGLYFFSGADGSRMQHAFGPDADANFGTVVDGFTGPSGTREFLVGAPSTPVGSVYGFGAAHRLSVDPMLSTDAISLSVSAGGSVTYDIDFPAQYAGHKAVLLASIQGSGTTFLNGVGLPIGPTNLLDRTTLPPILGDVVVLDAAGDGSITLTYAPGELSLGLGKHLEVCAAGLDPVIGSLPLVSSTQMSLKLLP
ncbi:MAG: integrin alpha [Planctomycetota bacterium]